MKHYFICSLCHRGVLGGCLIVDEQVINYKTGKVTVDSKYRNLVLNRDDIRSVSWKWVIFPKATFEMKNGEKYSFLIFNRWRFVKVYESEMLFYQIKLVRCMFVYINCRTMIASTYVLQFLLFSFEVICIMILSEQIFALIGE